ncbi:hypothetical protein ACFLYF_04375 [Chloroflexota bacterium]
MKYRVHHLRIKMTQDADKLESFLNNLKGEVVAIIPNISIWFFWIHKVDFLLIVEKTG